jgi:hypothetical protein
MSINKLAFTPGIKQNKQPNIKRVESKAKYHEFKSSSTSNIFLNSTISSPNVKNMIKAVATILQSQLNEDMNLGKTISKKSDLYFFSEEKYIDEYPQYFDKQRIENIKKIPTLDDMINFIEALYNCVQFSSECCIISLIYINRIIALTGLSLQTTNWRPLIFVSLMISQKIWDDKYLSNGDFSYIYPFFEKAQLNILEMKFLEMIQYNVYVKLSVYMTFYLELKTLVQDEYVNKAMSNYDFKKSEHLIKPKVERKLRRNKSEGKFLISGEYYNYVIS